MRIIKLTIFIVVFFFCVEFYLKYKKPTPYLYDSELGWTLKKDFKYTYKEKDLYNNQYSSFYSTDSFGARTFIQKGSSNKINPSVTGLFVSFSKAFSSYCSNFINASKVSLVNGKGDLLLKFISEFKLLI
jgi:hypothetical protein